MRTLALAATVTVLGSVGVFAALHPSGVDSRSIGQTQTAVCRASAAA